MILRWSAHKRASRDAIDKSVTLGAFFAASALLAAFPFLLGALKAAAHGNS